MRFLRHPILVVLLLVAGMIAPALRAPCACCVLGGAELNVVAKNATPVAGPCCSSDACREGETTPHHDEDTDDGPVGCDCTVCACTAAPVIYRARPAVALVVPIIAWLDEQPVERDRGDDPDGLDRPPQA